MSARLFFPGFPFQLSSWAQSRVHISGWNRSELPRTRLWARTLLPIYSSRDAILRACTPFPAVANPQFNRRPSPLHWLVLGFVSVCRLSAASLVQNHMSPGWSKSVLLQQDPTAEYEYMTIVLILPSTPVYIDPKSWSWRQSPISKVFLDSVINNLCIRFMLSSSPTLSECRALVGCSIQQHTTAMILSRGRTLV